MIPHTAGMNAREWDALNRACWTCGYPTLRAEHAEWCVGRVFRYYLDVPEKNGTNPRSEFSELEVASMRRWGKPPP